MKTILHSPWVIPLLALFLFCEVSTLRAAVHAEDKAQSDSLKRSGAQWTTNFSLQTDWHIAQDKDVAPRLTGITYLDGSLRSQYLDVGLRLEEKRHPLPGREEEKGWGLPYFYLRGRYAGVDVTVVVYSSVPMKTASWAWITLCVGYDSTMLIGRSFV